jgi:hypothetical protein
MDTRAGPARLEWRVNRSTCVGPLEIELTATAGDVGWEAVGSYAASVSSEDREAWPLFMPVLPYPILVLPEEEDDAWIKVNVEQAEDGRLILTAPQ